MTTHYEDKYDAPVAIASAKEVREYNTELKKWENNKIDSMIIKGSIRGGI